MKKHKHVKRRARHAPTAKRCPHCNLVHQHHGKCGRVASGHVHRYYVVAGGSRLGPMSKSEAENIRRGYGAGAHVESA